MNKKLKDDSIILRGEIVGKGEIKSLLRMLNKFEAKDLTEMDNEYRKDIMSRLKKRLRM